MLIEFGRKDTAFFANNRVFYAIIFRYLYGNLNNVVISTIIWEGVCNCILHLFFLICKGIYVLVLKKILK